MLKFYTIHRNPAGEWFWRFRFDDPDNPVTQKNYGPFASEAVAIAAAEELVA